MDWNGPGMTIWYGYGKPVHILLCGPLWAHGPALIGSTNWLIRSSRDMPFVRIPEVLIDQWRHKQMPGLRISEAREHWDYLYSIEELAALRATGSIKKRTS